MHTVLILSHAAAGSLALAAGLAAMLRPGRWLRTYVVALTAMLVLLVAAMGAEWTSYDGATRLVFVGLTTLGLVVVGQGWRAHRLRPAPGDPLGHAHRDALGFTLVALVDAFLVVAVMDLGAPGWAVVVTALVVAGVGHALLHRSAGRRSRVSGLGTAPR